MGIVFHGVRVLSLPAAGFYWKALWPNIYPVKEQFNLQKYSFCSGHKYAYTQWLEIRMGVKDTVNGLIGELVSW